ncbi:hypothetical protein HHI36_000547 [Cryptolaemus montrouzieri]|uniref:Secreted protein n=1 Tax=Cryptolaemus montrouzieri TaxID=559131 RepID=A0ABD2P529_9CUCU
MISMLLLSVAFCNGVPLYCKCWEGYRAQYGKDGAQCFGIRLMHIMPCNVPQPPRCICSGSVNNILKDGTGTWCTTYKKGHELRRWPCENTKEWDDFFKKHPDFN